MQGSENVHLTIGDSDSVTLLYSDILRKKLFLCCPKAKRALTKETLQKAGKGKAIVAILARCITALYLIRFAFMNTLKDARYMAIA